jgi:hypothetical protein
MKTTWKWIPVLALAAATAYAQADFPGEGPDGMPPPGGPEGRPVLDCGMPPPPPMRGPHGDPGMQPPCAGEGFRPERDFKGPTEEQRAEFAAFRKLCKEVRTETDEAKKAELVESLRAKLGEMADHQRDAQRERLAAAEKRIEEQKARLDRQVEALRSMIAEGESNRDEWIESQVQCILSGERPPMRHPHHGKGFGGTPPEGRGGPRCAPPCDGPGTGCPEGGPRGCRKGNHGPKGPRSGKAPCGAPCEGNVPAEGEGAMD